MPNPSNSPNVSASGSAFQRQRTRVIEQFVYDRIRGGDPSPTVREIVEFLGLSVSAAHNSVRSAVAAGRLVHDADKPRSLRPGAALRFEIDAIELTRDVLTHEQYLALTESLVRSRLLVATALEVRGDLVTRDARLLEWAGARSDINAIW